MATESVPYSGEMIRNLTKLATGDTSNRHEFIPKKNYPTICRQCDGMKITPEHGYDLAAEAEKEIIRLRSGITKLVERIMPVTFENSADLFQEYWGFDPNGKQMPELLGMFSAHLDRVTIRYCMENVRWGKRLFPNEALKDAYSRKCEGEYCLSNDSTRAEPCNQEIEASQDPEVVLCKKCREEEA